MSNKLHFLSFATAFLLLASCRPASGFRSQPTVPVLIPWVYSNLRALDAGDSPTQALDLLALYTRQEEDELQLRLDFLDLTVETNYDLYLAFDTAPGGEHDLPIATQASLEWETLLVIPATREIQTIRQAVGGNESTPQPGLGVTVLRDPVLDTLTISLDRLSLVGYGGNPRLKSFENRPKPLNIQLFLTRANDAEAVDILGPVNTNAEPPPPAQAALVFWNVFPAYSPAQALRRWDGAHTGPYGGRHGLYNLLRTAQAAQTPLVLLDLNTPGSLSALDSLGKLELIREISRQDNLILSQALPYSELFPEGFPAWAIAKLSVESWETSRLFGIPDTPFLFLPTWHSPLDLVDNVNFPRTTRFIFTPPINGISENLQPDVNDLWRSEFRRWKDLTLLPLPDHPTGHEEAQQLDQDGLTIEARRSLIQASLESKRPGHSPVLIFGGDLPNSPWGDPQAARAAFAYLKAHPWIKILRSEDLLSARSEGTYEPQYTDSTLPFEHQIMLDRVQQAPSNLIGLTAWQAYLSLFAPLSRDLADLPALRAVYLEQIGSLLAAADWSAQPTSIADCSLDPDRDGQTECILASPQVWALFEAESGSLTYLFVRFPDGQEHQLVAPSSQFITGLSEPSTWQLDGGLLADPSVIPGAFTGPGQAFLPAIQPGKLAFISSEENVEKIYTLTPMGLRVEYKSTHGEPPFQPKIPIAIDPWERFFPGWVERYLPQINDHEVAWKLDQEMQIKVQSSEKLTAQPFTQSRQYLSVPENPNLSYPPAHFLPYPISLIEVSPRGDFWVLIEVSAKTD